MLKVRRIGAFSVLASALLVASLAVPTSASAIKFGAKLTSSTQPQGASTCSDENSNVPVGAACTWIAQVAFENGSHYKAPSNGTIKKLRLVACDGGKFTLQLVKPNSTTSKWKLIKTGPTIHYQADPRQADNNCGGDDGEDYLIQTFSINVPVVKGEYIAVKTAKNGMLHCSGDSMPLYYPALSSGQGFRTKTGGTGCALLVQLQYG